jgi:hypothetical protein
MLRAATAIALGISVHGFGSTQPGTALAKRRELIDA